jgi:MinD-like ATPase involved in chromosome partitioning or flagellar assembly
MTTVVAITSGQAKGGKSILGPNLAQYLKQKEHRTGLIVAGARQPVWGIEPDSHWPAILEGRLPLEKAIHRDVFGIDLMVARDCGGTLHELCIRNGFRLVPALDMLDTYAYLIVDCTALTSQPALACCLAADTTLLILPPDTARLAATYEWLAHLTRHGFRGPVHVVLDPVDNPPQARSIYLHFRDLVQNQLSLQTSFWGFLNKEPGIDPQTVYRSPLLQTMAQSELLRNIQRIGNRLVSERSPEIPAGSLQDFWRRFLEYLNQIPTDPAILQQNPPAVPEGQVPVKDFQRPATENAQALAWLNTQLTNIAHDLQAIRRLLEAGPAPNGAPSHRQALDFDTFAGRHQKREES